MTRRAIERLRPYIGNAIFDDAVVGNRSAKKRRRIWHQPKSYAARLGQVNLRGGMIRSARLCARGSGRQGLPALRNWSLSRSDYIGTLEEGRGLPALIERASKELLGRGVGVAQEDYVGDDMEASNA